MADNGTGIALGLLDGPRPVLSTRATLSRPIVSSGSVYVENRVFGLFAYPGGYLTGGDNGFWDIDLDLNAHLVETTGAGVYDFSFADLDGDGDQDVMSRSTRSITFWERTAAGLVSRFGFIDGALTRPSYALGDVDNDGDIDLATYKAGAVAVAYNNGDFTFKEIVSGELNEVVTQQTAYAAALHDDNADGQLDLSIASPDDSASTTLLWFPGTGMEGSSRFGSVVSKQLSTYATKVVFGDVTRDGILDAVIDVSPAGDHYLQVVAGTAPGVYAAPVTIEALPGDFSLVDLDADGTFEIVLTSQDVRVLRSIGGGSFESETFSLGGAVQSVAVTGNGSGQPIVAALFVQTCGGAGCDDSCGSQCIFNACADCLVDSDCGYGSCVGARCSLPDDDAGVP